MSSRRSRRAHTAQPKYSVEDYDLDTDLDSYGNSTSSSSRRSTRLKQQHDGETLAGGALGDDSGAGNEEDGEMEEVTRCICGNGELQIPKNSHGEFDNVDSGFFIQCETCSVWQHGYCVGIIDEETSPEKYWCEQCKPENHTLFTDKYGVRRSRYDPSNPHHRSHSSHNSLGSHKKGIKRKNGRFVSSKSADAELDDGEDHDRKNDSDTVSSPPKEPRAHNEAKPFQRPSPPKSVPFPADHRENDDQEEDQGYADAHNNGQGQDQDLADDAGDHDDENHKRKHRKRSSYYNYEEMLKKALEESAKESGVVPEEINISSNEGAEGRELRHATIRKTRTKSNDTLSHHTDNGSEMSRHASTHTAHNEDVGLKHGNKNDIEAKAIKAEKHAEFDDKRKPRDSKRNRSRKEFGLNGTVSTDEHDDDSNHTSVKNMAKHQSSENLKSSKANNSSTLNHKRGTKKDKKEPKNSAAADDKPFRANIPSVRINMNEMTRRIFSIMDFVSNIQLNLSNEEEFKNNLFKMDEEELTPEIIALKNSLIECYNDSVSQLDHLTTLLNTWQGEYV